MSHLFELNHETRQIEQQHADGTWTLYTLRRYENGEQIAWAQEADATRRISGDVYDVEWSEKRWHEAQAK